MCPVSQLITASYGFNKAHSVGYSIIATMMAYIKANYKTIFYDALLNVNQESGERKKKLFDEAKKNLEAKDYIVVVNDKEEYLGGAIAPGMNGSLNSLIANAAKLSHTALVKPEHVIGNDTTTCIQSGMIYGTASMIDGMVNKTIEELGLPNVKVVLTGGLAPLIKDVLTIDYIYEPNILIEGLIYLYYKNTK